MTYYIAFIFFCGICIIGLYHKNQQDTKQEIRNILQQYMVLDNQSSPEEHTTL